MNTMSISKGLTAPQIRFVAAYIRYGNASKAIRIAYPVESKTWTNGYINNKAYRMVRNGEIMAEIKSRKQVMEDNANLAAHAITEIITKGKEHNKLDAAKFAIEQADGKATQLKEVRGLVVGIRYDLSGGQAGAIPQSVLDELAEDDDLPTNPV